jgi:ribosomal protein S18 acetylase RimI-like enzyme
MEPELMVADYHNLSHGSDMAQLLSRYAEDPMGGGKALEADIADNLARELGKLPHAFTVLCYVNQKPAGLVNCFETYSSFKGKPLVNIHDVIVVKAFRGLGLSQLMLEKVEDIAKQKGCCKLTLEVLEGNDVAQHSYRKFGFAGYELDPVMGQAMFWQKSLEV